MRSRVRASAPSSNWAPCSRIDSSRSSISQIIDERSAQYFSLEDSRPKGGDDRRPRLVPDDKSVRRAAQARLSSWCFRSTSVASIRRSRPSSLSSSGYLSSAAATRWRWSARFEWAHGVRAQNSHDVLFALLVGNGRAHLSRHVVQAARFVKDFLRDAPVVRQHPHGRPGQRSEGLPQQQAVLLTDAHRPVAERRHFSKMALRFRPLHAAEQCGYFSVQFGAGFENRLQLEIIRIAAEIGLRGLQNLGGALMIALFQGRGDIGLQLRAATIRAGRMVRAAFPASSTFTA